MKAKTWIFRLSAISIITFGFFFLKEKEKKKVAAMKAANDRLLDNSHLFSHWLEIKSHGKDVSIYFKEMGYNNIAIYGMGEIANRLIEDLGESTIHVAYGIDRDISCCTSQMDEIYSLQDALPEADVVIVTPYYAFESIKHDLESKVKCPIISIEEVVWSV